MFLFFVDDETPRSTFTPDITDTVELSWRLLAILSKSDPTEAEQDLKKLRDELNLRSKNISLS